MYIIKYKNIILLFCITIILVTFYSLCYSFAFNSLSEEQKDNRNITWVDFNINYNALADSLDIDIKSHNQGVKVNWVDILACLASQYGGDFKKYRKTDLLKIVEKIKSGEELKQNNTFSYYREAYGAVLDNFVGEYEEESNETDELGRKKVIKKYGLKVFSPIAKGYSFNHYDDFGSSRSYGFRRKHLGHDLMGSIGTPVIAVESGVVENVGWNKYGGWRIGIRSFDKKRYHYYAHLRKDHPFNDIYEGKTVKAGDVIGYLGMTGYSDKENVNNINVPHLHYGLELIFDEKRRNEKHEIWIDLYALIKLLEKNKSEVYKDGNEFYRKNDFFTNEFE